MHPHLTGTKLEACSDVIAALHECHKSSLWTYYTGGCNDIRNQMNKCLHQERLDRSAKHVKEGVKKRKELEKRWKQMDAEK